MVNTAVIQPPQVQGGPPPPQPNQGVQAGNGNGQVSCFSRIKEAFSSFISQISPSTEARYHRAIQSAASETSKLAELTSRSLGSEKEISSYEGKVGELTMKLANSLEKVAKLQARLPQGHDASQDLQAAIGNLSQDEMNTVNAQRGLLKVLVETEAAIRLDPQANASRLTVVINESLGLEGGPEPQRMKGETLFTSQQASAVNILGGFPPQDQFRDQATQQLRPWLQAL